MSGLVSPRWGTVSVMSCSICQMMCSRVSSAATATFPVIVLHGQFQPRVNTETSRWTNSEGVNGSFPPQGRYRDYPTASLGGRPGLSNPLSAFFPTQSEKVENRCAQSTASGRRTAYRHRPPHDPSPPRTAPLFRRREQLGEDRQRRNQGKHKERTRNHPRPGFPQQN